MTARPVRSYRLEEAASKLGYGPTAFFRLIVSKGIQVFACDKIEEWETFVQHPVDMKAFRQACDDGSFTYKYNHRTEEPEDSGVMWDFPFEHRLLDLRIGRNGFLRIADLFEHSADYRSVSLSGKSYSLSKGQAAVIKILHEVSKTNLAGVSGDEIDKRLGPEGASIKGAFQKSATTRDALIEVVQPGIYRLRL